MSFEKYIKKNGKKYRMGYTTGSSAAAAAKAAAAMLYSGKIVNKIKIKTPTEIELELDIIEQKLKNNWAQAAVVKDAGDDPDVTDGLKIYARIEESKRDGILIEGGEGVGTVTKPGLPIKEGKAAINPVPRKMIKNAIREIYSKRKGIKVTISVEGGKKVAKKTFNPRLGIEGGISILGTTGIVEPMSESAYKESLAIELKQAAALGEKDLVFVFGNHGKNLAIELGYKKEAVVRMSNFVGYILDQTKDLKLNSILIIGHIGKIVKVAGGIFNTYSKKADARKEIIAAYTALLGGEKSLIEKIFSANTAEEISAILVESDFQEVFDIIAKRVVERVHQRLDNNLSLSAIIFSLENGILGSYNCKEGIENE